MTRESLIEVAIKVDVDTHVGTKEGIPVLAELFRENSIPASFFLSLGPDQTGRAIFRIFQKGFLKKVMRTKVKQMYGLKTLLYGTLLPSPHIGRKNTELLSSLKDFEVGIHSYNHCFWQNRVHEIDYEKIYSEFQKAQNEFGKIFGFQAKSAAAPGWQINEKAMKAYEKSGMIYSSDTRGEYAFFPKFNNYVSNVLQIPTTLPTLDEYLGRDELPEEKIPNIYLSKLRPGKLNVLTIHAEIEGMGKKDLFERTINLFNKKGVKFVSLESIATKLIDANKKAENNLKSSTWDKIKNLLKVSSHSEKIPICQIKQGEIDGRGGNVALQVI